MNSFLHSLLKIKFYQKEFFVQKISIQSTISSTLFKELLAKDLQFITKIRNNMKNKLMGIKDKILLCKRAIIETINDQLKNISQIEHTRHRSPANFLINLLSGLIAYCHQYKKPSLKLPKTALIAC